MINCVETALYAPVLKLKLGELKALATLPRQVANTILPLFDVPPGDIWDWDNFRLISASEHLKTFGSRLRDHRGSLPVFIDTSHIEAAAEEARLDIHPMIALTERARQAGAQAFPAVSLRSTESCMEAAKRFLGRNSEANWLLRVRLPDLDQPDLSGRLDRLLLSLGRGAESGVLVFDAHNSEVFSDGFAELIKDRINEFPLLHQWANVFFASTSFPKTRKLSVGTVGRFSRSDRKFFRENLLDSPDLLRNVRYADYGLEYPGKFSKGGGVPRAHLRFSSPELYLISEGESTKGNGFKAIGPVAALLSKQPEFAAAPESAGRTFVKQLAARETNGSPTSWRWCATDHHICTTTAEALLDAGIKIEVDLLPKASEQLILI